MNPGGTTDIANASLPIVLFVEDDSRQIRYNKRICESHQGEFAGHHAENMREAMDFLEKNADRIIVVVVDMRFPRIKGGQVEKLGIRLIQEVRSEWPQMKCVACSLDFATTDEANLSADNIPALGKGDFVGYRNMLEALISRQLPHPEEPSAMVQQTGSAETQLTAH